MKTETRSSENEINLINYMSQLTTPAQLHAFVADVIEPLIISDQKKIKDGQAPTFTKNQWGKIYNAHKEHPENTEDYPLTTPDFELV